LPYLQGQYFFLTTAGHVLVRRMEPPGITAGSALRVRRAGDQPGDVHVMAPGEEVTGAHAKQQSLRRRSSSAHRGSSLGQAEIPGHLTLGGK
jgi:hypothetical protein